MHYIFKPCGNAAKCHDFSRGVVEALSAYLGVLSAAFGFSCSIACAHAEHICIDDFGPKKRLGFALKDHGQTGGLPFFAAAAKSSHPQNFS